MKRSILLSGTAICAVIAGALLVSPGLGQDMQTSTVQQDMQTSTVQGVQTSTVPPPPTSMPIYNPYPAGIVPADVLDQSELERVRGEVRVIFGRALAQMAALPPPNVQGNPPTLQGSGFAAVETLGKLLNYDERMSPFQNEACAVCHLPYVAFSGPIPDVNATMIAYPGTLRFRAGKRSAQRYTYSPYFPVLRFDAVQGAFFGGNFWDGRSTGFRLDNPDAEQAQHPPVDTQEMGFPDTACIAFRLSEVEYRPLFEQVWGVDFDIKFPQVTRRICATPGGAAVFGNGAVPIPLSPDDRTKANRIFDAWGQSISVFERSVQVSPFTSKFDAFLAGSATLTPDEQAGYDLFRGKAGCNTCHLDGRGSTQTPGTGSGTTPSTVTGTDTSAATNVAPLFTCFGYANLGLPLNPRDAFFFQTTPDGFGFTPNPFGFGFRDLGLGTFLRSGFGAAPNPNSDWVQFAPTSDGQMQTMTVRNVGMAPPQCPTTEAPGPFFQKEFFHNGYIKSLKQLVHFYNTRDVFRFNVTSGNCPAGTTERVDCWPMAEVPNNIDMTVGNLGLSDQEENLIVTFMQTLTDGFTTPFPDSDTFTGVCQSGGTAATQGNDLLIPTPPLPPCAAAICGVPPLPGPLPIP